MNALIDRLQITLEARADLLAGESDSAFRLLAGFYEGNRNLVADLYGRTLVLWDYSDSFESGEQLLGAAQEFYLSVIPGVDCVVWKYRTAWWGKSLWIIYRHRVRLFPACLSGSHLKQVI